MKVAIVTPYHDPNSPYLKQCAESVRGQIHGDNLHILVGDGCKTEKLQEHSKLLHIQLSKNIGDYGDSPRSLGAIYAFSLGADAVAFLDSDNWFAPDHIDSLIELHRETQADVLTSFRNLTHLDGSILGVCPESDGQTFCDTNCMLFTRRAKTIAASWWTIPPELHAIDDRIIWDRILKSRLHVACTGRPTVNYRTAFAFHYRHFGLEPPPEAKSGQDIGDLQPFLDVLYMRARHLHMNRNDDENEENVS